MEKINLAEKFTLFSDHWNPRVIGELNGQSVKIAKVKGEFVWHNHKDEDELFYIIKGTLKMQFEDKMVEFSEGEMLIIPKGVEHRPIADEEVWLMLFEPIETKHTGDTITDATVTEFQKI